MDGRKKALPNRISIEPVKGDEHGRGGGHVVEHSFDNSGTGESYRLPEKHLFTSHKDMMAHLKDHLVNTDAEGGEDGSPRKPAAAPAKGSGVGKTPASPKPVHGGGMD